MARQGASLTDEEIKEIQDDLKAILEKALKSLDDVVKEERSGVRIFITEFKVVAPLFYRLRAHMADWNCLSHNPCLTEMTVVQKMLKEKIRFDDNRVFDLAIENAIEENLKKLNKMKM